MIIEILDKEISNYTNCVPYIESYYNVLKRKCLKYENYND